MSSKGSAYGVTLLGYAPDGTDAKDHVRYLVRWQTRLEGEERRAWTRGYVTPDLQGLGTGAKVNLLRDGRGSIIHIERAKN